MTILLDHQLDVRSVGSCTYAKGTENPEACTRIRSCASTSVPIDQARIVTMNIRRPRALSYCIHSRAGKRMVGYDLCARGVVGSGLCCMPLRWWRATSPNRPTKVRQLSGSERLGWNQSSADPAELPTYRYVAYVDGARSDLADVSCVPAGATQLSCSARLPTMSPGSHTIELATVSSSGAESERSAPLMVNAGTSGSVTTSVESGNAATATTKNAKETAAPTKWSGNTQVVTQDGVRMRLEQISDAVVEPIDMSFLPDGRLLVAEREGRVQIVSEGRLLPQSALLKDETLEQLHAIAVDPQFDRTHFVYTVFTSSSRSGARTFGIARFREVSNTLAERVIIRDQIARASSAPSASLRVAADGKLLAAFDDADSARLAEDLSSANGKILRLNPDGTTPDDQAGGSPLFSYVSPFPAWFRLAPDVTSVVDRRPRSSRLESPQRRGDG